MGADLQRARRTRANEAPVLHRIDQLYIDNSTVDKAYRLETYRSTGAISTNSSQQLRCYFVSRCVFPTEVPPTADGAPVDIRHISDKSFLEKASDNTLEIYQSVLNEVARRSGPVIEMFEVEESRERRVVIGYKMGTTQGFFSALSDLYHFYGLFSARCGGACGLLVRQCELTLGPPGNTSSSLPTERPSFVGRVDCLLGDLKLNFLSSPLPQPGAQHARTSHRALHPPGHQGGVAALHPADQRVLPLARQQCRLAARGAGGRVRLRLLDLCAALLQQAGSQLCGAEEQCVQRCSRWAARTHHALAALDESNPTHAEVLQQIKVRFRDETFTRQFIQETIMAHPDIVRGGERW